MEPGGWNQMDGTTCPFNWQAISRKYDQDETMAEPQVSRLDWILFNSVASVVIYTDFEAEFIVAQCRDRGRH